MWKIAKQQQQQQKQQQNKTSRLGDTDTYRHI